MRRKKASVFLLAMFACFSISSQALASSTVQYTYDSLNRITSATYDDGAVIEYAYDSDGNRLTQAINGVAPPCATDITGGVTVTRGGFQYNRTTGHFMQQITLQNASNASISGPVFLALDNLSSNAALSNKSGSTSCATPVSPYIPINLGAGNLLVAGGTASVILDFSDPGKQAITYSARVLSGNTP